MPWTHIEQIIEANDGNIDQTIMSWQKDYCIEPLHNCLIELKSISLIWQKNFNIMSDLLFYNINFPKEIREIIGMYYLCIWCCRGAYLFSAQQRSNTTFECVGCNEYYVNDSGSFCSTPLYTRNVSLTPSLSDVSNCLFLPKLSRIQHYNYFPISHFPRLFHHKEITE
jgi:hypothetical protein